ncbi:MAG TPA: tripartite tricarboxylate transporter TctB family protein [Burkholderiales bacterium]|nr:tripartite tricarboxylate transporter TctB family protein [Burkholderiales bacterium]
MRNADRVTAALLLAFSVAFAAGALKQYQWWGSGGPGPAFMPFWLGLVMALLALMMLTRSLKEKDPGPSWFPRGEGLRDLLVVLGVTILFVALMNVLGMVIGTAVYLAVLVRYLGRHPWWMTLSVAIAAAFFNWLVFVHWLHVPFPEGKLWIF